MSLSQVWSFTGKSYAKQEREDKKGIFSAKFWNGQKSVFGIFPHYLVSFHIISLPSSQSLVCPLFRSPGSKISQSALNCIRAILPKPFTPTVFHVPKLNTFSHHNLKNNDPIKAIVLSVLPIRFLRQKNLIQLSHANMWVTKLLTPSESLALLNQDAESSKNCWPG